MGVQTEILKRTFTGEAKRYEGDQLKTVQYTVGSGALIGGTPGQIYDVAYGPVVHTTNLPAEAEIGSFVEGRGVIVNSPEYALFGKPGAPIAPSLTLPANTVVSVMTAGHVWVKRSALAAIKAGMNSYVIYQPDGTDENDLCIVEVNGLLAAGDSGSTIGG